MSIRKKIVKEGDATPSDFEEQVAQALFDLEATNAELKSELKELKMSYKIGDHDYEVRLSLIHI